MSSISQMATEFSLALQRYEDTVMTEGGQGDAQLGPTGIVARDALGRCVTMLAQTQASTAEENDAKMQILQRPEARQFFEQDAYEELMWALYIERLFLAF